jgi:hypothetical protein
MTFLNNYERLLASMQFSLLIGVFMTQGRDEERFGRFWVCSVDVGEEKSFVKSLRWNWVRRNLFENKRGWLEGIRGRSCRFNAEIG